MKHKEEAEANVRNEKRKKMHRKASRKNCTNYVLSNDGIALPMPSSPWSFSTGRTGVILVPML
jgi:hypothetical protein